MRDCVRCGIPFVPVGNQTHCTKACTLAGRNESRRARRREARAKAGKRQMPGRPRVECLACGKLAAHGRRKFCSQRCGSAFFQRNYPYERTGPTECVTCSAPLRKPEKGSRVSFKYCSDACRQAKRNARAREAYARKKKKVNT